MTTVLKSRAESPLNWLLGFLIGKWKKINFKHDYCYELNSFCSLS